MIQTALVSLLTASVLTVSSVAPEISGSAQLKPISEQAQPFDYAQGKTELGSRSMSLDMRYGYDLPENVYKDNILLNLAYLSGTVKSKSDINWDQLKQPKSIEFSLEPGQRFAYHGLIDPKYQDNVALAVDTNFGAGDGYKFEGGLYGMGVCHLASLIHWAALDAGLESIAPSNHDFYPIPEIPKEYGVAVYNSPDSPAASVRQNLYIKNTLESKVTFKFDFDGDNLRVSVLK
ncbi:MAG TPA: VanW family protein [Patescibacteria group bacterium]|nr:VanW family protein [Patescibacteria group bacterium]